MSERTRPPTNRRIKRCPVESREIDEAAPLAPGTHPRGEKKSARRQLFTGSPVRAAPFAHPPALRGESSGHLRHFKPYARPTPSDAAVRAAAMPTTWEGVLFVSPLPVTVATASGRLVRAPIATTSGWEDGREQQLSDLASARALYVLLMIDSSSSVVPVLKISAGRIVVNERRAPEDRFGLSRLTTNRVCCSALEQPRPTTPGARRVCPALHGFNARSTRGARAVPQGSAAGTPSSPDRRHLHRRGYASVETSREPASNIGRRYVSSNTRIGRARRRPNSTPSSRAGLNIRFNELKIGDLLEGLRVIELSGASEELARATGGVSTRRELHALDNATRSPKIALPVRALLPRSTPRATRFPRVEVDTSDRNKPVTSAPLFRPSK